MHVSDDVRRFVQHFREEPRALDSAGQEQLSDADFHLALCRAVLAARSPLDHRLAIEVFREEMRVRRVDPRRSGDRLVLSALVLAQFRDVSDVLLLWEAKRLDFDMGCYFDAQLLVFSGVEITLSFLYVQPGAAARAAAEYVEACRIDGTFAELDRYWRDKMRYFGLPQE